VRVRQLRPPSPFHGEGVGVRERLPDHDVAVALEALEVCRGEGRGLRFHEVRLLDDGAPQQTIRPAKPARPIYRRAVPHGPPRGAVNDDCMIPRPWPGQPALYRPAQSGTRRRRKKSARSCEPAATLTRL
jgi:hypothetical protein